MVNLSSTGRAFKLALAEWRWNGEKLVQDSGALTRLGIDRRAREIGEELCSKQGLSFTNAQTAQMSTPSAIPADSAEQNKPSETPRNGSGTLTQQTANAIAQKYPSLAGEKSEQLTLSFGPQ